MTLVASVALVMTMITAASARKCCGPSDILGPDLGCVPGSDHRLLALPISDELSCSGNLSLVKPYQDMRVDCLDVARTEGTTSLKGVVCSAESDKIYVPQVHFVRKCCPEFRRYSNFREGCWGDSPNERRAVDLLRGMFLNDTATPVELAIGAPECPRGSVLVDIFLHHRLVWRQDSESILLKHRGSHDQLLVPEEFCVDLVAGDNYSLVVRACQDASVTCGDTPCINKCCRDGTSYRTFSCDETKDSFEVQFYSVRQKTPSPIVVQTIGIAYEDAFFKCANGKFPLDPTNPEDSFLVTDSGSLLIPENPLHRNLIDWKDFCLERLHGKVVPFICFPERRDGPESRERLHFLMIALGLVVSGVFLLITFLVYACLPSLHNLHGRTLMCHVASLLAAYTFLVSSQLLSNQLPSPLCAVIGYGIQFFFLAAFSWLNVICFDIWWTFGAIKSHVAKAEESRRKFLWYSLYAWLVPLAITSGTFLVDTYRLVPAGFLPNMGLRFCWFPRDTHGKTVFFNLPVMIQITTNMVFFALTIRNCSKIKSELQQMQNNSNARLKYHADINKLAMNSKLFIVMGLTWGCEVVTWYLQRGDDHFLWYLLDAANIFQGFFIFFIFVIKKKVIRAMKLRVHEVIPSCFSGLPKHRPSTTSTVFTTVASSEARQGSQIHK